MRDLFLIFSGFIICGGATGFVYCVYSYINRRVENLRAEILGKLVERKDAGPIGNVSITPIDENSEKAENQTENKAKVFWNDKSSLSETARLLQENELETVPNVPQLQNLSLNEAYHAIADRIEELNG